MITTGKYRADGPFGCTHTCGNGLNGPTFNSHCAFDTEFINLKDENKECGPLKRGPLDYPIPVEHASGGLLDQKPMICGGYEFVCTKKLTTECYMLDMKEWTKFADLKKPRSGHSTVVISNDDAGERLWIVGGHDSNKLVTEYVYSDKTVKYGPDLPKEFFDMKWPYCMVQIENGSVIMIGHGHPVIFSGSEFVQLANELEYPREKSACAMFFSNKHGRNVIAVVGGIPSQTEEGDPGPRTGILDYSKTQAWDWHIGNLF